MGRVVALVVALAGALLLAWQESRTPPALSISAPADVFSADRALVDVAQIARAPHPTGSAENRRVRDYLIGRMTALGLTPTVHAASSVLSEPWGGDDYAFGGDVENIVGVLPGRDRSAPAIALMAHYDSVPGSPGAADDATGVAAILETIRALRTQGPPARDIIVLITDGEEAGLLGAKAFFAEHPLRKRVGMVINLEARGNGGRAAMFQTGPDNGEIISAFASSATRPVSNSLAVFLYENMPNDTDFTISKEAGIGGLNFAFIGRQFDYHSPTATVANLDRGSVQHIGDQALAATRTLAYADRLPGKAPDKVYSQAFGDVILAYPAWGGWILLAAALGLIAWTAVRARKAGELALPDTLRGVGASLTLLTGGAVLLRLVRRLVGVDEGYVAFRPLLAQWTLWETVLALVAVGVLLLIPVLLARGGARVRLAVAFVLAGALCSVAGWDPIGLGLGVAAGVLAFTSFGRPAALPGAWLGALAIAAVVAIGLQIALPTVTVLVAWPLAAGALAAAVTRLGSRKGAGSTVALIVVAAAAGGWLAVYFDGVAQGLDLPDILILFPWLAALAAWPLAADPSRRGLSVPLLMFAVAAVLVVLLRFGGHWTERHPQTATVLHVSDSTTGQAWRVTQDDPPAAWTLKALGAGLTEKAFPPLVRRPVAAAPTRAVPLPSATVEGGRQADGSVRVTVRPPVGARVLILDVKSDVKATQTRIQDHDAAMLAKPGRWTRVRWVSAPDGLTLAFRPAGPGKLEIRHAAITDGWPAGAEPLPARPANTMPFDQSDSAVTIGATTVAW
ncbi:M20/M25/M40 family metallo-hydrolase [Caulobacter mirabilis]|uniref:Vacuolar membrane protease n=1 Tax=Caulobacter mirabilis TaxID=69666 RepID=A0A2D2AV39_9CAUL|nr:M20/M25/M40 family metallo-hydrolase [Caulobacter mirabilis]ATQ41827.1 peptidase M20 [Caulobacter mirabilis]